MNVEFPSSKNNTRDTDTRTVIIRNLFLDANIGVYHEEQGIFQPILINAAIEVITPSDPMSDHEDDVFCYHKMVNTIRAILSEGHIKLVETVAEHICAHALAHEMVKAITVRVEKPNAIGEADGVGVEIYRSTSSD